MQELDVKKIRIDGDTQSRVAINDDVVTEYAEAMKGGANLAANWPPIVAFYDGSDYWLADGFHRVLAAIRAGITSISVDVKPGGRVEAAWHSAGANATHGLRRNNFDKRRSVEMAFSIHPDFSDRSIAEHCGVSQFLVSSIRKTYKGICENQQNQQNQQGKFSITCDEEKGVIENSVPDGKRIGLDGKKYPPAPYIKYGPPPVRKSEQPVIRDCIGRKIPDNVVSLWMRRKEAKGLVRQLAVLKTLAQERQEGFRDPLYAEVDWNRVYSHLAQASQNLKLCIPYALCPYCHGMGCKVCKDRGLVSKFVWDTLCPNEFKEAAMREAEGGTLDDDEEEEG